MNDEFADKKGIRWNPKEMLTALVGRLEIAEAFCDRYEKQLGRLENIIKEALTEPIEDCYYVLKHDYKTYQQEFYEENKE